jgi:hypothetical protein
MGNVTITGGTFIGAVGIYASNPNQATYNAYTLTVNESDLETTVYYAENGNVNVVVNDASLTSQMVPASYQAKIVRNNQNVYFATLQKALEEAKDNETIVLLQDVNGAVTLKATDARKVALTLDINGQTITNQTGDDKDTITVEAGSSLTIQDSKGTGKIVNILPGHKAYAENADGDGSISISGTVTTENPKTDQSN